MVGELPSPEYYAQGEKCRSPLSSETEVVFRAMDLEESADSKRANQSTATFHGVRECPPPKPEHHLHWSLSTASGQSEMLMGEILIYYQTRCSTRRR